MSANHVETIQTAHQLSGAILRKITQKSISEKNIFIEEIPEAQKEAEALVKNYINMDKFSQLSVERQKEFIEELATALYAHIDTLDNIQYKTETTIGLTRPTTYSAITKGFAQNTTGTSWLSVDEGDTTLHSTHRPVGGLKFPPSSFSSRKTMQIFGRIAQTYQVAGTESESIYQQTNQKIYESIRSARNAYVRKTEAAIASFEATEAARGPRMFSRFFASAPSQASALRSALAAKIDIFLMAEELFANNIAKPERVLALWEQKIEKNQVASFADDQKKCERIRAATPEIARLITNIFLEVNVSALSISSERDEANEKTEHFSPAGPGSSRR